jgi:hypothetical protein
MAEAIGPMPGMGTKTILLSCAGFGRAGTGSAKMEKLQLTGSGKASLSFGIFLGSVLEA